jgi:hypothetical protein
MRHQTSILTAIPVLFLTGAILSGDTIAVTLSGDGPVSDGVDYVLPYQLTIGGVEINAVCYDFFDEVQLGETWWANELTLDQAAAAGQYSGVNNALNSYEKVAWLSSQATPTPQSQIDLQHIIWNIFDAGQFSVTTGMADYMRELAVAQSSFSDSSFASYSFIEAPGISGTNGHPQAFVIQLPGGSGETGQGPTPEPDSVVLLVVGLGLIGVPTIQRFRR